MNRLLYFLKEGFSKVFSRRSNTAMTAASVCIVAAVLTLVGLFAALYVNLSELTQRLGNSAEINVYLKADADGRDIADIETDLKHIDGVKGVRFYSREDRLEKVSREVYGEDGAVFKEGENPLRDSYIITAADLSKMNEIIKKAEQTDGVDEVVGNSDMINGIQMFISAVKKSGIWLMLIPILLAVFIIANTIRLKLSFGADEIRIMRIVGATDSFIRTPYIIQGIIIGILGAILGGLITVGGYAALAARIESIIPQGLMRLVSAARIFAVTMPAFILFGAIMGIFASAFAIRRHFKMNNE